MLTRTPRLVAAATLLARFPLTARVLENLGALGGGAPPATPPGTIASLRGANEFP
jgi:hypothetical protein